MRSMLALALYRVRGNVDVVLNGLTPVGVPSNVDVTLHRLSVNRLTANFAEQMKHTIGDRGFHARPAPHFLRQNAAIAAWARFRYPPLTAAVDLALSGPRATRLGFSCTGLRWRLRSCRRGPEWSA